MKKEEGCKYVKPLKQNKIYTDLRINSWNWTHSTMYFAAKFESCPRIRNWFTGYLGDSLWQFIWIHSSIELQKPAKTTPTILNWLPNSKTWNIVRQKELEDCLPSTI